ncbi:MAG: 50S ribosomal protein L13 [Bacteroidota bacterium]
MDTLSYKTISANKATAHKDWIVVDASNEILGRLSSKVAKILRGKYKTNFTPHVDCGDNVIVINAEKIRMTGKKWTDRKYFSHTGYPGGQVIENPERIFSKNPAKLIELSVKRMLPKSKLGYAIYKNLYVYAGSEHPHEAQQPKELNLNDIK